MADFFFCMMAAQRGWSIEEIADTLLELSPKAQERARSMTRAMRSSPRRTQLQQQSAAGRGAGDRRFQAGVWLIRAPLSIAIPRDNGNKTP
jgi:hypothetical protein